MAFRFVETDEDFIEELRNTSEIYFGKTNKRLFKKNVFEEVASTSDWLSTVQIFLSFFFRSSTWHQVQIIDSRH